MTNKFIESIENVENTAYTENGGVAFKHTDSNLLDLNFKVPQLRQLAIDGDFNELHKMFNKAYLEDKKHSVQWLFFLRDIREGLGERSSFRSLFKILCIKNNDLGRALIPYISKYGRWDDVVNSIGISNSINNEIFKLIKDQLISDLAVANSGENKSISLLGKWLPSENASSNVTKRLAIIIQRAIGYTPKEYRKTLSQLRAYLDVVEVKTSNNSWDEIKYSAVPSKANILYKDAFLKHDLDRRTEFLASLERGEEKINSNATFPHDITHSYLINKEYGIELKEDATLEEMWKSQKKFDGFKDTLVIRDGSGSMDRPLSRTSDVTAMDVADAITLYCCENNTGVYRNKFITFSSEPEVVDISECHSLCSKLSKLQTYDDCENTDIQRTFTLILNSAMDSKLRQEDLPSTILIISDMEFDLCTSSYDINNGEYKTFEKSFDIFSKEFEEHGYKLPKIAFWNVNSRTNTIPMEENENGVVLVSGFAKDLLEMICSSEIDPYRCLIKKLESGRYDFVNDVM